MTHQIKTNRSVYHVKSLSTENSYWKYREGFNVGVRGWGEGESAKVLKRVNGLPFPHYKVLCPDGSVRQIAQLELITLRHKA